MAPMIARTLEIARDGQSPIGSDAADSAMNERD